MAKATKKSFCLNASGKWTKRSPAPLDIFIIYAVGRSMIQLLKDIKQL